MATTTAEKITYEQAKKAVEQFDREFVFAGQESGKLWEQCMKEAIKSTEPDYQWGDPVYVNGVKYGIYMWEVGDDGEHNVLTKGLVRTVATCDLTLAPYRIRLRDDDDIGNTHATSLQVIDGDNKYRLVQAGKSAQVEIIYE